MGNVQVSDHEVKDQLGRILAEPQFQQSSILTDFLSYVVKETLQGNSNNLKEYTIGTSALSKKPNFDTQSDASVRIHAGRLRKALNAYYSGPGKRDPILISIPKGSYVPRFEANTPKAFQAVSDNLKIYTKPTLAVLPFRSYDKKRDAALADGLCDQLSTDFTTFNEISVLSYYSAKQFAEQTNDLRKIGQMLDVNYVLTGNIQSVGDNIRIRVQLTVTHTLQQIWAETYERSRQAFNTFTLQDDIVRHVINQIGGSLGIIIRNSIKTPADKQLLDIKVYDAVFWFYHLIQNLDKDKYFQALNSMKASVDLDNTYALGWAVLAETYVAGHFYGYLNPEDHALDAAVRCGRMALELNKHCHHAYQSLALAYVFRHDEKSCLAICKEWLALHANVAGVSGGLGFCLICCGEYEQGHQMLSESIYLNPYYPWWFNAGLCMYHLKKGDHNAAFYWADKLQGHSRTWELLFKITALMESGQEQEANVLSDVLVQELDPAILPQVVSAFIHDTALRSIILDRNREGAGMVAKPS